ncbi:MAG: hypothetical protein F2920_11405, partial [Actinobacteria bacterium]|nr:hypothetical protein [Actinomycetota bacterium]
SWSPDGTKIVFVSSSQIYVMDADGSNQTNISNNSSSDDTPAWSPDGSKIAFMTDRDGNYSIYSMNPDGSNPTAMISGADNYEDVSWQSLPIPTTTNSTPATPVVPAFTG